MIWTPDKINNYKQASEYTSFHKKLSVLAEPYLDRAWTLADVGCGPGLLSLWLAPMVASIDAIDNDSAAIDDLKTRLDNVILTDRVTADKIRPRLASIEDLEGDSWDVLTLCFFGVGEEILDNVLPLAKRRALIYMHGRADTEGPLASMDDGNKFSVSDMENYLARNDLAYKKSVMEMQFGQPFRGIEDIHKFLMEYESSLEPNEAGTEPDNCAERRVTDVEERIVQTNRYDYPYYLPKSISVALFIIRT